MPKTKENAMRRLFGLLVVALLALAVELPAAGQDSTSPSLGDLARQVQKDRDSNRPNAPTRTLTNDDLSVQAGPSAANTVVSLPDKAWGVQANLSGFRVTSNGLKEDGRAYLLAENDKTGVT